MRALSLVLVIVSPCFALLGTALQSNSMLLVRRQGFLFVRVSRDLVGSLPFSAQSQF
jgi:hypothetical protein